MRWLALTVGVLTALLALVAIVGALLPRNHVARRTVAVRRAPADLWTLVSDPAWNRQASESDVPVELVESQPPRRIVYRIADPNLPFGGTWTYDINPTASGSTLTITEDGYVSNVIVRFVSKFIMGHHATMDTYLKNVAKRFNEPPALSGE